MSLIWLEGWLIGMVAVIALGGFVIVLLGMLGLLLVECTLMCKWWVKVI